MNDSVVTVGPNGTEVEHDIEETLLAVVPVETVGKSKEKVCIKVDGFLLAQCGIHANSKVAVMIDDDHIVLRRVDCTLPATKASVDVLVENDELP